MTGQHRGKPAPVRWRRLARGRRALVGALVVPGLVLGGVVVLWPDPEAERKPQRAVAGEQVESAVPRTTPTVHPTFGEYVPPKRNEATPQPKVKEKAPRPQVTTRPPGRQTRRPDAEICAEYGRRNPWVRHWCERHGYDYDDHDRD
ncbi:hypothetical protein [Thermomonospora amylolytica]|uniref:hypothetical protein n=1 Tax=Thermomonospora amylolytica TaxID=1411117 RepID=UPI001300BEAF|nr:hypothetical protein [Thermomonospora amylolytica]